jgi:nucleoside-diphosphate-sugar epimerase
MPNSFLVTGGAGFIGSHLVRRMLGDGDRVRVVDNLVTGNRARLREFERDLEFMLGDLADPDVCNKAVQGMDYVLHQAAVPSVQRSLREPLATNRANVTATLNLLESCRKNGVRRLVYAASSSAYGNTKVLPKKEDMAPNPLSPYALQKHVGERYCQLYNELYHFETVCLRYFNVFGPAQDPNSEYSAVIPKFITRLRRNQTLVIYGDGEQSRDFTYIDNVVDANCLALKAPQAAGAVVNIGCGERITLNKLIEMLEDIMQLHAVVDYQPTRIGDVRDSLADITRAQQVLGYRPHVDLKIGLRNTAQFFAAQ